MIGGKKLNTGAEWLTMMKDIAVKAVIASKPTTIVQGEVIATSPLSIQIDQKLILPSECLRVPQHLTDYEVNIEIDTATEATSTNTQHTHEVNYLDTTINGGSERTTTSEIGSFDNTHTHEVKGTKTITFYNALKVGDKVILIRQQGRTNIFCF